MEYAYILTLQWSPRAGSLSTETRSGIYTMNNDVTRDEALNEIKLWVIDNTEGLDADHNACILFFSLERNAL